MTLQVSGQVGESVQSDGAPLQPGRQGRLSEWIMSQLRGRFGEMALRGRIYHGGMALTAINNATFTTATLGATCTPIAGVWNPTGSGAALEVLQAQLALTMTALAATGGGPYAWYASTGNTLAQPTTGSLGINGYTLKGGGVGYNMAGAALTGLTNNLTLVRGSALGGGSASNASFTATAVAMQTQLQGFLEDLGGGFIVPPGGVLALLATTTPVAHSATSGLIWAQVPPT